MYFEAKPDIYDPYGIIDSPKLPRESDFKSGHKITGQLPDPLIFSINHPESMQPKHFLGAIIPVLSNKLIEALRSAGADNFQIFPAVLKYHSGKEVQGYQAFNVLDMVDAVNMELSNYATVMGGSDKVPSLGSFNKIVLSLSRSKDLPMLRIPQDPTPMFWHKRIVDYICENSPTGGWGITLDEVEVAP